MNGQTACFNFPVLDLKPVLGYRKAFAAFQFFPKAATSISSRHLTINRTFHMNDRSGSLLGISSGDILYPMSQKEVEKISALIIALEDKRFLDHHGIDLKGIARSLVHNLMARRIVEGGSTITQQLVRNTLLTPDRSLTRKVMEIVLALIIEKHYSKQEILDLYCQSVYLGNGQRGFATAAKFIYRRPFASLSFPQTCALLGLLRLPSTTYPKSSTENFLSRQSLVMKVVSKPNSLNQCKTIPDAQTINPIQIRGARRPRLSHILEDIIRREFPDIRPIVKRVTLTLDSSIQQVLDYVLKEASLDPSVIQTSGIILDNKTGDVLAESSWQRGLDSEFSPSFSGNIQPGSTFKTFALLSALEQGFTTRLRLQSSPFESSFIMDGSHKLWKVRNYGNIYREKLTLKDALAFSDNTVFARLSELLDLEKLFDIYARFQLTTATRPHYSVVLGAASSGISLLQLASAYRAIARNGIFSRHRLIRSIELTDTPTILRPRPSPNYIIAQYDLIQAIKPVLAISGLSSGQIEISGKTGTAGNSSLFAGYTDNISLALWLGYNKPVKESNPKAKTAKGLVDSFATKLLGYSSNPFTI